MLGHDQNRQHVVLIEEREQLMDFKRQKTLLRHGLQIAIETVDYDDLCIPLVHSAANQCSKLARRHFGGVDLMEVHNALCDQLADLHSQSTGPLRDAFGTFVESIKHDG